jgi:sodium transport system permease protein
MNLRQLGIIYRKEFVDLLRDRRTIISMFVVPVVVMPLLVTGLGLIGFKVARQAMRETPRVMVLGGEDSPKTLAALHALDNFVFVPPDPDYATQISNKTVRAAVEIPAGFDAALASGTKATVRIYNYQGEIKSEAAAGFLQNFFRDWRTATVNQRLAEHNLSKDFINPFAIEEINVAPLEKVSGNLVGAVIPYIIIMMCLAGSIYSAVDLTAGEKERGTMETLLCSPVARVNLVVGKCLMVLTVSLVAVLLSLCSTGVSFLVLKSMAASYGAARELSLTINPASLLLVFGLMLPVTLFFASLMLAVGLFSRSVKEANSYLQPLMVFMFIPAVSATLPGLELDAGLALVPVLNVSLISKEILSGTYHWGYIALIFGTTCAYAALALRVAVMMFQRESVLFRT